MTTRGAAVRAARQGWAVFPCRPGDKRPAVDRWEQRACADPDRVARYWPGPRHNIGGACGPSGRVVVDLDTAAHGRPPPEARQGHAVDGRDVLAALAELAGQPWPSTYAVATPNGGLHLVFAAVDGRAIRNSAGKIGLMIDVRGSGGYVLLAGSVVDGRSYEVAEDRPVASLPPWLADLADPPRPSRGLDAAQDVGGSVYGRLRGVVETVLKSEPGTRNGRLYWAACRAAEMVASGQLDQPTAERVLLDAALEAGLRGGEAEAQRTIASGLGTR